MSANDQSLLQQWVHDRDAEAFRTLAMRHASMVYNTSRRILRDPTGAEDVAQECFEALVRAGDKPGAYLGAWLHRVATNLSFNHIEAQRRRQTREDRFAENSTPATESYDEDLYAHVDKAIVALPDKLRYPLVAHFLENQTHDAIAESIGVSRQTITYRIGQAVDRVRATLKRRGVMIAAAAFADFLRANSSEAVPARLAANLGKIAVAGSSAASVGLSLAGMHGLVSLKAFLAAATIVAVGGAGVFALRSEPNTPSPATPAPATPAKLAAAHSKRPAEPERKKSPAPIASPAVSTPVPQSASNTVQPAPTNQGERRDGRAEVERILEGPVSLEFESIQLAEVLEFVSDSLKLNLALDTRVVSPRSQPGAATAPVTYDCVTDGMVPHVDVRNVSLGDALRTLCSPLGLDFAVNNGIISISSPTLLEADGLVGLNAYDDASDPVLQQTTSLVFEGNHISEILEFAADSLDVNITIDHRAVTPPGKTSTTVNEVVEAPVQLEPPFVTTGHIPYISLKDVTLSEALTAILRPMNLAYSVEDGFVWISTPDRIEQEPFTPPDTSNATTALIDALQTPRDFEFDKTPLAEALATMAQRANVSIEVDTKNTNITAATVNNYIIKGIPFSIALNIILRQHDLTFLTDGQDIIVTSPARAHNKNIAQWNAVPVQQLPNR